MGNSDNDSGGGIDGNNIYQKNRTGAGFLL